MSATVFLTTGTDRPASGQARLPSIDGREMLSWNEIRRIHLSGFEPAAHTMTHPNLTRLGDDRLRSEICGAKSIIQDEIGSEVDLFAYPFGRYNSRARDVVAKHFAGACSVRLGLVPGRLHTRRCLRKANTPKARRVAIVMILVHTEAQAARQVEFKAGKLSGEQLSASI